MTAVTTSEGQKFFIGQFATSQKVADKVIFQFLRKCQLTTVTLNWIVNNFRRLSFIILERLSCGHELCTTCLEEARKSQQPGIQWSKLPGHLLFSLNSSFTVGIDFVNFLYQIPFMSITSVLTRTLRTSNLIYLLRIATSEIWSLKDFAHWWFVVNLFQVNGGFGWWSFRSICVFHITLRKKYKIFLVRYWLLKIIKIYLTKKYFFSKSTILYKFDTNLNTTKNKTYNSSNFKKFLIIIWVILKFSYNMKFLTIIV